MTRRTRKHTLFPQASEQQVQQFNAEGKQLYRELMDKIESTAGLEDNRRCYLITAVWAELMTELSAYGWRPNELADGALHQAERFWQES